MEPLQPFVLPVPIKDEIKMGKDLPLGVTYCTEAFTVPNVNWPSSLIVVQKANPSPQYTLSYDMASGDRVYVQLFKSFGAVAPDVFPVKFMSFQMDGPSSDNSMRIKRYSDDKTEETVFDFDTTVANSQFATGVFKYMNPSPWPQLAAFTDTDNYIEFHCRLPPKNEEPVLDMANLVFVRFPKQRLVYCVRPVFQTSASRDSYMSSLTGFEKWYDNLVTFDVSNQLIVGCGQGLGNYAAFPIAPTQQAWTQMFDKTVYVKMGSKEYRLTRRSGSTMLLSDVTPVLINDLVVGGKTLEEEQPTKLRLLPNAVTAIVQIGEETLQPSQTAFVTHRASVRGHGSSFSALFRSKTRRKTDIADQNMRLSVFPGQAPDGTQQFVNLWNNGNGMIHLGDVQMDFSSFAINGVPRDLLTSMTADENIYAPLTGFTMLNDTQKGYRIEAYFTEDVKLMVDLSSPIPLNKLLFVRIHPYNIIFCVNTTPVRPSSGTSGKWYMDTSKFTKDSLLMPIGDGANDMSTLNWPTLWNGLPLSPHNFVINGVKHSYDGLTMYKNTSMLFQTFKILDKYDITAGLAHPPPLNTDPLIGGNMDKYFATLSSAVSIPTITDASFGTLAVKTCPNSTTVSTGPFQATYMYRLGPNGGMECIFMDPRLEDNPEASFGTNKLLRVNVDSESDGIMFENLTLSKQMNPYAITLSPKLPIADIMQWATLDTFAPYIGRTNVRTDSAGEFPIEFYFQPKTNPTYSDLCFVRFPKINVIYCLEPGEAGSKTKNHNADFWWTKPELFKSQTLYMPAGQLASGFVGIPIPVAWVAPVPTNPPRVDISLGYPPIAYQYNGETVKPTSDALGDSLPDKASSSTDIAYIVGGIAIGIIFLAFIFWYFGRNSHDDYRQEEKAARRRSRQFKKHFIENIGVD